MIAARAEKKDRLLTAKAPQHRIAKAELFLKIGLTKVIAPVESVIQSRIFAVAICGYGVTPTAGSGGGGALRYLSVVKPKRLVY